MSFVDLHSEIESTKGCKPKFGIVIVLASSQEYFCRSVAKFQMVNLLVWKVVWFDWYCWQICVFMLPPRTETAIGSFLLEKGLVRLGGVSTSTMSSWRRMRQRDHFVRCRQGQWQGKHHSPSNAAGTAASSYILAEAWKHATCTNSDVIDEEKILIMTCVLHARYLLVGAWRAWKANLDFCECEFLMSLIWINVHAVDECWSMSEYLKFPCGNWSMTSFVKFKKSLSENWLAGDVMAWETMIIIKEMLFAETVHRDSTLMFGSLRWVQKQTESEL